MRGNATAVLLAVLLCAYGVHGRARDVGGQEAMGEYAVKRYLRQRNAWLKQRFPTNDSTLDADIAGFALPESESTVREASVTECKRQFVATHKRAKAGELPLQFDKYCGKMKVRGRAEVAESPAAEHGGPTVFFIESDKGLERAKSLHQGQGGGGWSGRAQIRLGRGGRRRARGAGPARPRPRPGSTVSSRTHQSGVCSAA